MQNEGWWGWGSGVSLQRNSLIRSCVPDRARCCSPHTAAAARRLRLRCCYSPSALSLFPLRHALPPCSILYSLDSYSNCGCLDLVDSWRAGAWCRGVSATQVGGEGNGQAQETCLCCPTRTSLMATSSPVMMCLPLHGAKVSGGRGWWVTRRWVWLQTIASGPEASDAPVAPGPVPKDVAETARAQLPSQPVLAAHDYCQAHACKATTIVQ